MYIFIKSQGETGKPGPQGYRGDEGSTGQEVRDFKN